MACALFTLIVGLNEWLQTLTARANLETIWGEQTADIQSILQQKVIPLEFPTSACGTLVVFRSWVIIRL